MQNMTEILDGTQGLAGVQEVLSGSALGERLRMILQANLIEGTQVVACRLQRAKFKPGRKLTAYYDLQLQSPGDAPSVRPLAVTWTRSADATAEPAPQTVQVEAAERGLVAPFQQLTLTVAELGMTLQISPFDPRYPQLVRLNDPHYVRECFRATGNTDADGLPAAAGDYTVTAIRYRPGQRHVLRYDPITSGGAAGPGTIFAKVYADDTGHGLTTTIHQVADWVADHTTHVTVLRPQTYLQDEMTMLYPWVRGFPLAQLLSSGERTVATALWQAGAALQLLHCAPASVTQGLPQITLAAEARSLPRTCEHIQCFLPAVGQTVQRLCAEIQESYTALPQEAPTFVHGDWKADHLLLAPDPMAPLTLIDFDACTLADPALDIGKFLADLAWWYPTGQQAALAQAQNAFLAGYNLGADHPRLQRAQLWAALIGVKMTAHRAPLFDRNWAKTTTTLINQYAHVFLAAQ